MTHVTQYASRFRTNDNALYKSAFQTSLQSENPLVYQTFGYFSGVPAVVDFAAMRDAVKRLGGDPSKINPLCPADLVIDHSVQVDVSRR